MNPPPTPPPDTPVLLFDGTCHLCNGAVRFVLRHERAPTLHVAALQSSAARSLLAAADRPDAPADSVVLIEGGRATVRSEAVLRVARHLRAPWSWLRAARLVPRPLRDWLYDQIARRRHRWFGRREDVCLVPAPERRARFLD